YALKERNADAGLDHYHPKLGYRWNGGRVKAFNFDRRPSNIASTIGKYLDARIGAPSFALDKVKVPILGREADFEQPTSQRVFRGSPYQLELTGNGTVAFAGTKVDLTGDFTVMGWVWFEAMAATSRRAFGWLGGTTWPWTVR